MRVLFISGVDVGGAPKSTMQLASRLAKRGHSVGVVLGRTTERSPIYDAALHISIKVREGTGKNWFRRFFQLFGASTEMRQLDGLVIGNAERPENALRTLVAGFMPDIVIANSFPREQMRWIGEDLHRLGIPMGIYLRESHALTHFTISRLNPAVVLANSRYLADAVTSTGRECTFAPSIVDLDAATVESTRRAVLLINPTPENSPTVILEYAKRHPTIPCVLQESWPLDPQTRQEVESWARALDNLDFRPICSLPSEVFRDARVLVAPYPSGRPRVVLEAQHNGIPVVGLEQPALAEAIGRGGILVPSNADLEIWVAEIERLYRDEYLYEELSVLARAHARRNEADPELIVNLVERALEDAIK